MYIIALKYIVLGALAKLRKSTINFVMPLCLFVRMDQLSWHWTDFRTIHTSVHFHWNMPTKFKFG